jgi:hypothetical protein
MAAARDHFLGGNEPGGLPSLLPGDKNLVLVAFPAIKSRISAACPDMKAMPMRVSMIWPPAF